MIVGILSSIPISMIASSALRASSEFQILDWQRLSVLPDPVGLKGAYAGISNGWIILTGGSNFPVPRSQGGTKSFADKIYLRSAGLGNAPWRTMPEVLPVGLAEGASVTTEAGLVAIGGQTAQGPVAEVTLFSTDAKGSSIRRTPLPSLPEPSANATAVYLQGHLYVAGGEAGGQGSANFWQLDLAQAITNSGKTSWRSLPSWPGPRRFGAMMVVLIREGREQIFLFGGRLKAAGPASINDYLSDAYRFDPQSGAWATAAAMPHRAIIATTIRTGPSTAALMGGSDGHDLERMAELGERYRIPNHIAIYDAQTNSWHTGGTMPIGVVGAVAVDLGSAWLVAGGEYSPSIRTAQAFQLTVKQGGVSEGAR